MRPLQTSAVTNHHRNAQDTPSPVLHPEAPDLMGRRRPGRGALPQVLRHTPPLQRGDHRSARGLGRARRETEKRKRREAHVQASRRYYPKRTPLCLRLQPRGLRERDFTHRNKHHRYKHHRPSKRYIPTRLLCRSSTRQLPGRAQIRLPKHADGPRHAPPQHRRQLPRRAAHFPGVTNSWCCIYMQYTGCICLPSTSC